MWLAELLDKVKRWEESELSGQPLNEKTPSLSPKKKLAPLNEGGPMQLLKLQMDQLREENEALRAQLKTAAADTAAANADQPEEVAAPVERVKEVVVVRGAIQIKSRGSEIVVNRYLDRAKEFSPKLGTSAKYWNESRSRGLARYIDYDLATA